MSRIGNLVEPTLAAAFTNSFPIILELEGIKAMTSRREEDGYR